MKVLKSVAEVRQWRKAYDEVAFVPTMGNLHAGHLSLVAEAKRHSENVIVSIFVNPLQFGEGEDLDSYPRTIEADMEKLESAGVSALFLPTEEILYGEDAPFLVVPPKSLIGELCGRDRPGHFEGVATVVTKFFNIVAPTYACFGKKDYQQLKVIEALVAALNFDIKIIPVAIEREESGLALSSRNGYLSDDERAQAVKISEVLKVLRENLLALDPSARPENYHAYENEARTLLEREGFVVDYLSIREQKSLQLAKQADQHLVVLVAAKCGKTRLLDNIEINY
ncbi:pantoate--beta-alanine ligase [Ignatzschineria sp. F8392]|uniref:pantoate--beta-alanine ligase n=1 Tax=Ignatzschineria sp. F8392 TaxID=1980117 RepID=UPI000B98EB5A|nr:pantoate--beta-alanine ligase [Ignatzschineria sp. F8392]OYQ81808.1 pantoate--beta-alanine ligase [Ignatzschineria sp. F8392]